MSSDFFTKYDRFLETSNTSAQLERLNARYSAIFDSKSDLFAGKRVLDIASHDGRWAFAALKNGASHVTGVEARAELISSAHQTLREYKIHETQYTFVHDDIFGYLAKSKVKFDVVLCLGFFYHTIRHSELFDLMERASAQYIVIDTEIAPESEVARIIGNSKQRALHLNSYHVQLFSEDVSDERMACEDKSTRNGKTIVGRPSKDAVVFLADHFGYEIDFIDWQMRLLDLPSNSETLHDYKNGWRTTAICRARD